MSAVTFRPARLHGETQAPPSKSEAHRALLLAALGRQPCVLTGFFGALCEDTQAMLSGVRALGAEARHIEGTLVVTPGARPVSTDEPITVDVRACAAALRMLLPALLARGVPARYVMDASLAKRPLDAYEELFASLPVRLERAEEPDGRVALTVRGALPAGEYTVDGGKSSQFGSGLMMALAHAVGEQGEPVGSRVRIRPPIASRPYLDMTLTMMGAFGCPVSELGGGSFRVSPCEKDNPPTLAVGRDYTQAAVWMVACALGASIGVEGLALPTEKRLAMQGDAVIFALLRQMGMAVRMGGGTLWVRCPSRAPLSPLHADVSRCPDLAPMLALCCTQAHGVSTLTGVENLRYKECDRLAAIRELLGALGARLSLSKDGSTLEIHGGQRLRGGAMLSCRGDHRMAMMLSIAATVCDGPITVTDAEALRKSWPDYLEAYRALGGLWQ